mmetsp:Transcript_8774/g.17133  ORF Transcript_8774/g.17133 Transcript_8774/m.17133 type:complete len:238 (+) Transcript_8774:672-1385(+)
MSQVYCRAHDAYRSRPLARLHMPIPLHHQACSQPIALLNLHPIGSVRRRRGGRRRRRRKVTRRSGQKKYLFHRRRILQEKPRKKGRRLAAKEDHIDIRRLRNFIFPLRVWTWRRNSTKSYRWRICSWCPRLSGGCFPGPMSGSRTMGDGRRHHFEQLAASDSNSPTSLLPFLFRHNALERPLRHRHEHPREGRRCPRLQIGCHSRNAHLHIRVSQHEKMSAFQTPTFFLSSTTHALD